MSTGNAGAVIGLPNSGKMVPIGSPPLVPDTLNPTAGVNYAGVSMTVYYDRNVMGEDAVFSVPSQNAGKNCVWVTSGASPIIVAADSKMAVTGGGVATASPGGSFSSFFTPGTTIPAGSWFWVET